MKAWTIACVLGLAVSAAASAQDTPPAPTPTPPPPPPLWSGKAEVSYVGTSGNTDTSSLGGGFQVDYKPLPWEFGLKGAVIHAETDDITTAESFGLDFRASRLLNERWDLFGEALYYKNEFAGIESRYGVRGGAGYKLLLGPAHFLKFDAAFGFISEDPVIGEEDDFPTLSGGVHYKWVFSPNAEFTDDFVITLNLDDNDDVTYANIAAVTAALTQTFALKASYTIRYDNQPVPGFEERDTITAVSLVAKF
jgi:putative salt-induced outer membrane protein